jgi:hypothetical protein
MTSRKALVTGIVAHRPWHTTGLRRERYLDRRAATEFFVQQELLPITNYLPDVAMLRKSGVKIYMAAGKRSLDKNRFYAETARVLAERLGCEMVVFPGHHGSFLDMPHEWAAVLRDILRPDKPI